MNVAKIGPLTALIGCLTLGGCACVKDIEQFAGEGFVTPAIVHPLPSHRVRIAARPASVDATESALARCSRRLYLEFPKSREEMKALEEKCRAVIVNQ